jgi:hypothetical protein
MKYIGILKVHYMCSTMLSTLRSDVPGSFHFPLGLWNSDQTYRLVFVDILNTTNYYYVQTVIHTYTYYINIVWYWNITMNIRLSFVAAQRKDARVSKNLHHWWQTLLYSEPMILGNVVYGYNQYVCLAYWEEKQHEQWC